MNIKIINFIFGENFVPILKYTKFLVIHKKDVFYAGLHTGANIIDLIRHDFGKFTPKQIRNYARQYFGSKKWPERYKASRLAHRTLNRHHIQFYIQNNTEISPRDAAHIAADWLAMAKVKFKAFPYECPHAANKWEKEIKKLLTEDEIKQLSPVSRKNLLEAFKRPFAKKPETQFSVSILDNFDINTGQLITPKNSLWD